MVLCDGYIAGEIPHILIHTPNRETMTDQSSDTTKYSLVNHEFYWDCLQEYWETGVHSTALRQLNRLDSVLSMSLWFKLPLPESSFLADLVSKSSSDLGPYQCLFFFLQLGLPGFSL